MTDTNSLTTTPADDQCLSLREVCVRFNICTKTAYREIARGKLKAFRAGSQWRVRYCDFRNYQQEGQIR